MEHSPYIEADNGRNHCRKFQAVPVLAVPMALPGERTNIQNNTHREVDSRQEKIRSDPHCKGDTICAADPASIRRQLPSLSPRHKQKKDVADQQSLDFGIPDLSTSSPDTDRAEDQLVLRRSDAWSEDSMDAHSFSLSSCVEQNCVYRSQRNHPMLADPADGSDEVSLHCVHWEDSLEGPAALLTYYAC